MVKTMGGMLSPVDDISAGKMEKLKNGEFYEIGIKNGRNPDFHKKVFKFLKFCFEHWASDREFMDENGQFDLFRKELIKLSGYYDVHCGIGGELIFVPHSLSFESMTQEEFEGFYNAAIQCAMTNIFKDCGADVERQLYAYF